MADNCTELIVRFANALVRFSDAGGPPFAELAKSIVTVRDMEALGPAEQVILDFLNIQVDEIPSSLDPLARAVVVRGIVLSILAGEGRFGPVVEI